jgi:hypothetical protein
MFLTGIIVTPEQLISVHQEIIHGALEEKYGSVLQHIRCNGYNFYS